MNRLRYVLISFLAEPAHPAVECTWADAFLLAPLVICQATGAAFHDQAVLLFCLNWLCWHILNPCHSVGIFCAYRGAKKSGVKRLNIHSLRHAHASLLIELGFSPLEIAERLGHEKIETTFNTYSHLYPQKQDQLADRLDKEYQEGLK